MPENTGDPGGAALPEERIAAVMATLAAERELPAIVNAVLDGVRLALEAERVWLLLAGADGALSPAAAVGRTVAPIEERDIVARASSAGDPQFIDDGSPPGGFALALVPLAAYGARIGALVAACAAPHAFSQSERCVTLALAAAGSLAVASALQHGEKGRLEHQLRHMERAGVAIASSLAILPEMHLRAAVRRGMRLWPTAVGVSARDFLRPVLQTILEHARSAVDAGLGALGCGDSPERPFEPWVYSGVAPETVAAIGRFPRAVGTLGAVVRQSSTIRVEDVHRHPAFVGFPQHHPEITSLLAVPIRYKEETLGNLYLANKAGGPFTPEDERIIESLAAQAAIALQQAYLRTAVAAHQSQLCSIFESAHNGILFVDAATGHVIANERAMEILGRSLVPEEGRAQYVSLLHHPDGRPASTEDLLSSRVIRSGVAGSAEYLVVRPDGRRVPILESSAPVLGIDNDVLGAVVTFEDISALKDLERLREEFAAMVAHDLRNPVQVILSQTRILSQQMEREEVVVPVEALRRIEGSALRLAQLAGDLLETARIELRRLPLTRTPVALAEAVETIVDRLRTVVEPHPVEVAVEGGLPAVCLDLLRFDQVLTNLLENAAKYSPDQSIIHVRVAAAEGGVAVSVRDEGPGISREEIPRLFDRFYQAERAREQKTGLGLGLYIAKGLVEAHGGRISVESEPGRGSVFTVWFPAGEAGA